MVINIATIFDQNYLIKTLAFHWALAKLGNYTFWFLCLDNETKAIMQKLDLPNVILMSIEELGDQELLKTRNNRSAVEFVFTAKSAWVHHLINKIKTGDALIFSDNDIIYFSSPEPLLQQLKNDQYSIGIIPHRFPRNKAYLNDKVGRYNAGMVYLIADANSRLCISDWRKDCLEWCYLKYEKDRFGDQLYLNKWPNKYRGVYEIPDKGMDLGSWSLSNFKITKRADHFFVDEDPLVCYHFHRVKFYIDGDTIKPLPIYIYHDELYQIYTKNIENAWKKLLLIEKNWVHGFVEKPNILKIIKQHSERILRNFLS